MITEPTHFESLYPPSARFDEVEKILSLIKKGASCELIGLPGTGKSSLLRLLTYNRNVRIKHLGENQKWFHFVYMDFSEVKKRPYGDVIKFMMISLSYSLHERNLTSEYEYVHKMLSEVKDFNDELFAFQTLKKAIDYLAIERELTVTFLFDRFDQYIPQVSEEFFSNLKILRNRAKYRFSCIFALDRKLQDLIEPRVFSEFYEFLSGNAIYLKLLDIPGLEFRFSYLEKVTDKKAPGKIKDEIIKLTGGNGKLARVCYEAVLASSDQRLASSLELYEYLLSNRTVRNMLSEIWNFLTPSEKKEIKRGTGNEFLEEIGLTRDGKIAIPLFETFLKTLTPQASLIITYDPSRNEITKGDENLTEKLSPSEFRLLRFLLQNKGRVCEKDEIITNVWKDIKTSDGVTDQALDQIIYRLRKKIEDDPNNPKYLQTIKGRGYKVFE